jgi:hypothetical protein
MIERTGTRPRPFDNVRGRMVEAQIASRRITNPSWSGSEAQTRDGSSSPATTGSKGS